MVGYPYTTKLTPLPLSDPPADSVLNTWNEPVASAGAVNVNVYVPPPLPVDNGERLLPPLLNVGVA